MRLALTDLFDHGIPVAAEHGHVLLWNAPQLYQVDKEVHGIEVFIVFIGDEQDLTELLLDRACLPGLVHHAHIVDHADDQALLGGELAVLFTAKRRGLKLCLHLREIRIRRAVDVIVEVIFFDCVAKRALAAMRVIDGS